jgi:hypothetical protein
MKTHNLPLQAVLIPQLRSQGGSEAAEVTKTKNNAEGGSVLVVKIINNLC